MYESRTTMITSIRTTFETAAGVTQATPSPTSSAVTAVARNHIDGSDAINIVFGIIGILVALGALVVGIYYGRKQLHNLGRWTYPGIRHWPVSVYRRPHATGTTAVNIQSHRLKAIQPADGGASV
ncbi:hypothetical protein LTR97_012751 [Elasticomyces elasticus]|uniref:Mid2 domain-containing protein n=1 Tax=Elasticomyces elasticus TaxID=574655 RepID=A0AAN7VWG0_9PEZI|nr:hypothetical protein LTR97_012751 [Elasticomyces elasticus]